MKHRMIIELEKLEFTKLLQHSIDIDLTPQELLTRWVKKNIAEAVVVFPEKQEITLKCAHCGEDFEPKDLRHRRVAKYCGYSCAGKGRMDVIKKKKS